MSEGFAFDEVAARVSWVDLVAERCGPWLSDEHPARSVDELVADASQFIVGPDGCEILVYALTYECDPDGVLVVVRRSGGLPGLASPVFDWDYYAEREWCGEELSAGEAVSIVARVVRVANRLLEVPE